MGRPMAGRSAGAMKRVTLAMLRRMPLPKPDADGDKNERGSALIVGGSAQVPGAVLLAGIAALRSGAGKLQMATDRAITIPLGVAVPEALVIALPRRGVSAPLRQYASMADAILVGPGMQEGGAIRSLVRGLVREMKSDATLVLDAAALSAAGLSDRTVITPHAGEMATLLGIDKKDVDANAQDAARTAAERFDCVVTLKGASTFIATPDEIYEYDGGDVGLATSGSGDTLAGIVAGLAARGADPLAAALWAVWAHGTAGQQLAKRIGRVGYLSRELLAELPGLIGHT